MGKSEAYLVSFNDKNRFSTPGTYVLKLFMAVKLAQVKHISGAPV
jgi:hypothetical protein